MVEEVNPKPTVIVSREEQDLVYELQICSGATSARRQPGRWGVKLLGNGDMGARAR